MFKNILLILCLVSCVNTNANNNDLDKGFLYESINNISPYVDLIEYCGEWDESGKGGHVRVVKGYHFGHTEIFLQWISIPLTSGSKKTPKLLATVPISEFTYSNSDYTVEKYSCDKKNNKHEINLVLVNANDNGYVYKVNIKPFSIGKYKYKESRFKD